MDTDGFEECSNFRDALNKVDDWWDFTDDITEPAPTDEELRRRLFTDDPEVINKRLADYTNY